MMLKYLSGIVLFFLAVACSHAQNAGYLSAKEFADKIKNTKGGQVVDVRTPGEFKTGHIQNASNIALQSPEFTDMASALDPSKPVFVYCLSGGRSASAVKRLKAMGFKEIYEMPGGMMEWRSQNLPEVKLTVASEGMSLKDYQAMLQSGKTVLVDFYAEWCAPCKKMKPFLDKISTEMAGKVTFIRIDADQNSRLCKEMGVAALPVLKVYRDGKETWNHTGFADEETLRAQLGK